MKNGTINDLTCQIVHILGSWSIEEVETFWEEWIQDLQEKGAGSGAIFYCSEMCRLVIEKKRAKAAA